jgi:ornithine cyclodeaminase/alanine dehydrogenase-like protein (mu-crystallin family)
MPKVDAGYEPKHESVRIRSREAEYIRQVAAKYDERFIDALYRIINAHRDASLGVAPVVQVTNTTPPIVESEEIEMDLDAFA